MFNFSKFSILRGTLLVAILLIISSELVALPMINPILPGDSQFSEYLPLLKNKRVAVFANRGSLVDGVNIVTALKNQQVNIVKIFSPEHGFDGMADAGAKVANSQFESIPLISLYGKKTKPSASDLSNVDVIVFDIQDVGVRYYTYISSLQRLMEAAANNHKPLIVLDRPNPNSFYIDGPILEPKYHSFVGLQPIPIVYGMTIGEYALMLKGQEWLELIPKSAAKSLELTVIPVKNYTHADHYQLSIPPSPNLPTMSAIYWYPSLGWFEGTKMSVGRGTAMPFQVLGAPNYPESFTFTPRSTSGAQNPPYLNQHCHGWDLQMPASNVITQINGKIQLKYLIDAYHQSPDKTHFFTPFFSKLAGNDILRQQIIAGMSESQIRVSWQNGIDKFKAIRANYLIYPEK